MNKDTLLVVMGFLAVGAGAGLSAAHVAVPTELWALGAASLGGGLRTTLTPAEVKSDVAGVETFAKAVWDELDTHTPAAKAPPKAPTSTPVASAPPTVAVTPPAAVTAPGAITAPAATVVSAQ